MRGLEDKVAVVTGAGGAIGRAICVRLAEAGCVIGACDKDHPGAAETADLVRAIGPRAEVAAFDFTDYDAAMQSVAAIEAALGPPDVLVNCAGWDKLTKFLDSEPALWDRLIAINLRGHLNMHHVVAGGMAQRGAGRIVNIASDAGRVGSGGEAVYAACKGGLIAFTKALARELARTGVTVNCVCPGPTDTALLRSFLHEGEYGKRIYEGLKRAIPMRRLGEPGDIAGIVAFLASDEAAFMTGQVVSVSGGLTMHG